jgi:hypothetical protein
MAKSRWLHLSIMVALMVSACGGGDAEDTTTSTEAETTTTATEADTTTTGAETTSTMDECPGTPDASTGQFPYVEDDISGTIHSDLDCITFNNGETLQAPSGQGGNLVPDGNSTIGPTLCVNEVDYLPNQLIGTEAFADRATDFGAQPLDLDTGDGEFELDDGVALYQIEADPIEIIVELIADVGADAWAEAPFASPNYLFYPAPGWKFSPADQAIPADEGWLIADPRFDEAQVGVVDSFGSDGHGEFVSNIVEGLGGSAQPHDVNLQDISITTQGTAAELQSNDTLHIAKRISEAAEGTGAVNVSLGTYECLVETDDGLVAVPPVMLDQVIAAVGTPVVAAAGNDGNSNENALFYPAAYGNVTGVGALGWSPDLGAWAQASFTNTNSAQMWAPGVRVVADRRLGQDDPPEVVAWSGTSFASPHVAACIADGQCN